jgi:cyclic pyranopterin phosphate synthase
MSRPRLRGYSPARRRRQTDVAKRALSHVDGGGNVRMVDVGAKRVTKRIAVAEGEVVMHPSTLARIVSDDFSRERKGNVIAVARIAGIMAAKRTHDLIPLAHPLPLTSVAVDIESDDRLPGLRVTATARVTGQTGVEMEALTAVAVACLTIYDMAKATGDRAMEITNVRLIEKRGGRSGTFKRKRGG